MPCSVLQLTGGVILGVALWLRHDPKISTLLGLEYDGNHAPSTFYISTYSSVSASCHVCAHHVMLLSVYESFIYPGKISLRFRSHFHFQSPGSWQQKSKRFKTNPAYFPAVVHCYIFSARRFETRRIYLVCATIIGCMWNRCERDSHRSEPGAC